MNENENEVTKWQTIMKKILRRNNNRSNNEEMAAENMYKRNDGNNMCMCNNSS